MFFFPWKKFAVVYGVLLFAVILLKWGVDGCIPNVNSPIFPQQKFVPQAVCDLVLPWSIYSKTQQERVEKQKNWFNQGPTAFEDDDGKPSMVLFSNDFMKLPVLLEFFPKDSDVTWQLMAMLFLISTLIALVWQWAVSIRNTPLDYDPYFDSFTIPKNIAAAQSILPEYLTKERKDKPKRHPGQKASGSQPALKSSGSAKEVPTKKK